MPPNRPTPLPRPEGWYVLLPALIMLCWVAGLRKVAAQTGPPSGVSFAPWTLPLRTQVGGAVLAMGAAGGLNSVHLSQGDLSGDGQAELVAYDRMAGRATVFSRQAPPPGAGPLAGHWRHAPDLEALLPANVDWLLLRDYDGDGQADLFFGLRDLVYVRRGVRRGPGGRSAFEDPLMGQPIMSTSLSGQPLELFVLSIDLPSIIDVDGDGDLDFLCFEFFGQTLEWHRNTSIELTGSRDGLSFVKTPCWGRFAESATICNQFALGLQCRTGPPEGQAPPHHPYVPPGPVPGQFPRTLPVLTPAHIGSTVTAYDYDGDGDWDLLIGDVSCREVNLLINTANPGAAPSMGAQVTPYPQAGRPADLRYFPGVSVVDVDGDGRVDLTLSPSLFANTQSDRADLRRSVWAYRDQAAGTAAPAPTYQTDAFLQGEMLDLGADLRPAFIDLDGDGLEDMVVGFSSRLTPTGLEGGLGYLLNRGTVTSPLYELADTVFMGVRAPSNEPIVPVVADFSGDGRPDLGWVLTEELGVGRVHYRTGRATPSPWPDPLAGLHLDTTRVTLPFLLPFGCSPVFTDIDGDGDLDLILGLEEGALELRRNDGAYTYTRLDPTWLGVGINSFRANLSIAFGDVDGDGLPDLITTDRTGTIRLYRGPALIPGYRATGDTLLIQNNFMGQYQTYPTGRRAAPALADLNGNGRRDLIIGQVGGGLLALRNMGNQPLSVASGGGARTSRAPIARLMSQGSARLGMHLNAPAHVYAVDALGRRVWQAPGPQHAGPHSFDTRLPAGAYRVMAVPALPGAFAPLSQGWVVTGER